MCDTFLREQEGLNVGITASWPSEENQWFFCCHNAGFHDISAIICLPRLVVCKSFRGVIYWWNVWSIVYSCPAIRTHNHYNSVFVVLHGMTHWVIIGLLTSRNSSVGRALDWRSKGPWFDPGFRHPPILVAGTFLFFFDFALLFALI